MNYLKQMEYEKLLEVTREQNLIVDIRFAAMALVLATPHNHPQPPT